MKAQAKKMKGTNRKEQKGKKKTKRHNRQQTKKKKKPTKTPLFSYQ